MLAETLEQDKELAMKVDRRLMSSAGRSKKLKSLRLSASVDPQAIGGGGASYDDSGDTTTARRKRTNTLFSSFPAGSARDDPASGTDAS